MATRKRVGSGVRLEAIAKTFPDGTDAVRDFSLDVSGGSFTVIVGPSGCGKTTTLRLIAGLEKATSGRILFGGKDVGSLPPHKRNVAMVVQQPTLYPHMTVRRNLEFPRGPRRWPSWFGKKSPAEQDADEQRSIREILSLDPLLSKYPYELSGGEQQRVALCRAILRQPDILLLDEPLSRLDPPIKGELRTALKELHLKTGMTILYVTHDPFEAMALGDQLAILRDGRLEQVGPPMALLAAPRTLFVAKFLGWPPPNVVEGELIWEGESGFFLRDGWKLPLSPDIVLGITDKGKRIGGDYSRHEKACEATQQGVSSSSGPVDDKTISTRVQIVFRAENVRVERMTQESPEPESRENATRVDSSGTLGVKCRIDSVEHYGGFALATLVSLANGLQFRSLCYRHSEKYRHGERPDRETLCPGDCVWAYISPLAVLPFDAITEQALGI
ncbi:MAG: ABC transporter ATP-binding protein [Gemmataceae bacterium]